MRSGELQAWGCALALGLSPVLQPPSLHPTSAAPAVAHHGSAGAEPGSQADAEAKGTLTHVLREGDRQG